MRCYGLNWDGGLGAHPDERYVVGVAESLRWPDRLNPLDIAPGFAYGHLSPYLLALVAGLLRRADPLLIGRALAALFDLGTVALTFALGRRVFGEGVGLLAAAFVALMVTHVQQAHFYTADVPLAFFVVGTLLFAACLAEDGRRHQALLAGAWAGLALGTKFSAALLVLPLGAACAAVPGGPTSRWKRGLESGGAALVAFAFTNPFALAAFPTFWRIVAEQAALARGVLDVPYTRQFHGTWPYLYPVVQQLRWGMGWPLGLVAFGGLVYGVWRAVREPPRRAEWVVLVWAVPSLAFVGALYAKFPRYLLPLTPLLTIYGARVLVAGKPLRRLRNSFQAKGVLAHWKSPACQDGTQPSQGLGSGFQAKGVLAHWKSPACQDGTQPSQGWGSGFQAKGVLACSKLLACQGHAQPSQGLGSLLICAVLICSLLHCLAFVNVYRSPHPWLTASAWLTDHVPRGAVVAVEQWDHPLPLDATGYDVRELLVFDEDTPEKWAGMEATLAEADYVVIASRRGYAALVRWPERYPLTARYYRLLFEGGLGFTPVACFGRYPRLGPLALVDDPAAGLGFSLPELCRPKAPAMLRLGQLDESFVVYDHPRVVIMQRGMEGGTLAPR